MDADRYIKVLACFMQQEQEPIRRVMAPLGDSFWLWFVNWLQEFIFVRVVEKTFDFHSTALRDQSSSDIGALIFASK